MIGCPGYNHKQTTYIAYGWGFGLLQHDMVERFLLHFFAMSAHTYTRGTWTTPEATHPDRDVASTAYVAVSTGLVGDGVSHDAIDNGGADVDVINSGGGGGTGSVWVVVWVLVYAQCSSLHNI